MVVNISLSTFSQQLCRLTLALTKSRVHLTFQIAPFSSHHICPTLLFPWWNASVDRCLVYSAKAGWSDVEAVYSSYVKQHATSASIKCFLERRPHFPSNYHLTSLKRKSPWVGSLLENDFMSITEVVAEKTNLKLNKGEKVRVWKKTKSEGLGRRFTTR